MSKRNNYTAPEIREIQVNAGQVLCGSNQTEKFGISENKYDDNDWE